MDKPLGPVEQLTNPRIPGLKADVRHWPDAIMIPVMESSALEDCTAGFLWTPSALQPAQDETALVDEVERVLQEDGPWAFADVLPASMSGLLTNLLREPLREAGFRVEDATIDRDWPTPSATPSNLLQDSGHPVH